MFILIINFKRLLLNIKSVMNSDYGKSLFIIFIVRLWLKENNNLNVIKRKNKKYYVFYDG